ncbi:MAG: hypothetical protein HY658_07220 [Actinobacteria bacterium]|nr:hypothetical protein [Actinomycetota bacterium]
MGIYLAVERAWGWPLLGSYRTGVLALGVVGMAMCSLSSPARSSGWSNALVGIAAALGAAALVLVVVGLTGGSRTAFVWLSADVLVLWGVSTVRHAFVPAGRTPEVASRA